MSRRPAATASAPCATARAHPLPGTQPPSVPEAGKPGPPNAVMMTMGRDGHRRSIFGAIEQAVAGG